MLKGEILVIDFMKPFEVVNPHYIEAVLRARSAPARILSYVHYVLFGRTVVFKICGKHLARFKV